MCHKLQRIYGTIRENENILRIYDVKIMLKDDEFVMLILREI
jgi:hypothetical protein